MDINLEEWSNVMQENEISASLLIYGYEKDITGLTKELGIEPDKALNKNEPYPPGTAPIPRSLWELNSKLPKSASLEEHVSSILEAIRPSKDRIATISKQYRTVVSVSARYYEPNPEIELDPAILKELGELGAVLWLDMYPQTGYHLNNKDKVKSLAQKLNGIHSIKSLSVGNHSEALALAEALAVFEDLSTDINNDLSDLFEESTDIDTQNSSIEEIVERLKRSLTPCIVHGTYVRDWS